MNMNPTQDRRFVGLVNGYDLFTRAIPSYDRLQEQVKIEIARGTCRWPWLRELSCLEIGSGPGATTQKILAADEGIRVIAIDNDPDMLIKLDGNLKTWGCEHRVDIVQADILEHLATVPDGTFHFVASAFALHNIDHRRRETIIREIFRVLLPGGKFVNADKYARDYPEEQQIAYRRQIVDFEIFETNHHTGALAAWKAHYERDEEPDLLFRETPAKEFMRSVGFDKVLTAYRENMEAVIIGQKH